jgi:hypothetical protein
MLNHEAHLERKPIIKIQESLVIISQSHHLQTQNTIASSHMHENAQTLTDNFLVTVCITPD